MGNEEMTTPSKELIDAVAEAYENPEDPKKSHATLEELAAAFNLTTITTRKMLITAGVYNTKKSKEVLDLYNSGYSVEKIMEETGLKYNSVLSYIPYSRTVYNLADATNDAKKYRKKRARLEEEKKNAEEASTLAVEETGTFTPLTDADLRNYPDGVDKLRSFMPFMLTSSQAEGARLIGDALEDHSMLMIYGSGNGKSTLLRRFVIGELPGFISVELPKSPELDSWLEPLHEITYQDQKYTVFSSELYTLMTENSLIEMICKSYDIPVSKRMKKEEKRQKLLEEVRKRSNLVLVFNDLDITDKRRFEFLYLFRDLNEAGASIIFCSQSYTYDEIINEHSKKRYKDDEIEGLRKELRSKCKTYQLTTMTRAEVYKYLDIVEKIYRLQFTIGAREELVELAEEPIRNGNTLFGIQTGCILTMTAIVEHAIMQVAEIRKMENDGSLEKEIDIKEINAHGFNYDLWNIKHVNDIIKKCGCVDVDGNKLISRNLIYYLYRNRTGGMDPNDLP